MRTQRTRLLLLATTMCLIVGLIPRPTAIIAQTAEPTAPSTPAVTFDSPPKIIDLWPVKDAELGLREPVTITFDQPMDQPSVTNAITVAPKVDGDFTWPDAQTLQFTPKSGWPQNIGVTLQIGTSARSVTGSAFEEVRIVPFRTASGLRIVSVLPAENGTVTSDTRITVAFDRPIVALTTADETETLPSPITIEPAITGKGEWVNPALYIFTPANPLPGGARYTYTIPGGLKAVDGSALENSRAISLSITKPVVLGMKVSDNFGSCGSNYVDLNCPIIVEFSEPMDRPSVETAFTLAPVGQPDKTVGGTFTWDAESKGFTFKPDSLLMIDTEYRVTIAQSALNTSRAGSLEGVGLFRFRTIPLPGVTVSSLNLSLEREPGQAVSISFRTLMKFSSVQSHIRVEPKPNKLTFDRYYDDSYLEKDVTTEILITFPQQENTTYTITLDPGAEDIYGNRIETPLVLTLRTTTVKPPPPGIYPIANGTLMTLPYNNGSPTVSVLARGSVTTRLELYSLVSEVAQIGVGNNQFSTYCRASESTMNPNLGVTTNPKLATLVRDWTETINADRSDFERHEIALNAPGTLLKPGLYVVRMTGTDGQYEFVASVTTVQLTVKRSERDLMVWATDTVSGYPVAGLPITMQYQTQIFQRTDGIAEISTVPIGVTDRDGIVRVSLDLPKLRYDEDDKQLYVIGQREGLFGVWFSCLNTYYGSEPTRAAYLYTDRPIYRPGETVYLKGILRARRDMTLTPLQKSKVRVQVYGNDYNIYGGNGQILFDQVFPTKQQGSFSAEITLPQSLPLGTFIATISFIDEDEYYLYRTAPFGNIYGQGISPQITFRVAAFRPPEFELAVKSDQKAIIQGDPLAFRATGSYYSGGVVSDATINWNLYSGLSYFNSTGRGNFSFYDERWPYFYNGEQAKGTVSTDATGSATIKVENTILSPVWEIGDGLGPGAYRTRRDDDPAPGNPPVEYLPEATFVDETNQAVSARAEPIMAHPAAVYVGIEADRWGATTGETIPIRLIAVSPDSAPIESQKVSVAIERFDWQLKPVTSGDGYSDLNPQWQEVRTEIESSVITTGADGIAIYNFTPRQPGQYRVRIETTDAQGRIASATTRLYISGYSYTYYNDPLQSTSPLLDKDKYKPGEVATVNIPTGFAGQSHLLITVERSGVLFHDVIKADGPIATYKLPITDAFAPGAFVSFVAYRGIDASNPQPDYRRGSVRLRVEPVARRLNVKLTPSMTLTTPRGQVRYDVLVTDSDGKPVPNAEVGFSLVDKSVLAIARPNQVSLEEAFYNQYVTNFVRTELSMFAYMPILSSSYIVPCCFGGGGGGPFQLGDLNGALRSNFKFNALWQPFAITDTEGRATVTATLPDNATTWLMDARAITADTRIGQATTEIIATLPLLARPVAPRFFVAGDKVQLATVINNNSGTTQNAQVTLKATNITLLSPPTQPVTIEAGKRSRVNWDVIVSADATNADLIFEVKSAEGYVDSVRPLIATGPGGTIPIYRYIAYDVTATAGALLQPGSRTEAVMIPGRYKDAKGEVAIRLESSIAAATVDSLRYLQSFPHDCVEQTASKLYPNVLTLRAIQKLKLNNPALETELRDEALAALRKLYGWQNQDGGWGWFGGRESDPLVTAYVILALMEAQDLKLAPNLRYTVQYSIGILTKEMDSLFNFPANWEGNRLAFYLYVIGRYKQVMANDFTNDIPLREKVYGYLKRAYEKRIALSTMGRAYLLMAYRALGPDDEEIPNLITELESLATASATLTRWEESKRDWWNWGSDTRTTAVALKALLSAKPNSALLPGAVRWLMKARTYDYWESTQETAWSVAALTDWMIFTDELQGKFTFATALNGRKLTSGSGSVTPETVRDVTATQIDIADLIPGEPNALTFNRSAGDGALYYTARLNLVLPADQAKAISRGVTITREYFADDVLTQPIASAKVGDTITVRLTFTTTQEMGYFVLEDPIPAGTETIDASLLTTSLSSRGPSLQQVPRGRYNWYYGWWYIDRTELRDQQVNLYARYLPRGTFTFTYQIRATIAGEFHVMPTNGYYFYSPDVFGRTNGRLFKIAE